MTGIKLMVGDLVELKSGGPTMSVDLNWGNDTYRCAWFAGAKHNLADFSGETLQKVVGDRK